MATNSFVDWIRFSHGPINSFLDPKWENRIVLPSYGPGHSGQSPLETSECAGALQTSVLKVRFIILEIERIKKREIVSPLSGDIRAFDKLLAEMQGYLSNCDISCPTKQSLQPLWKAAIKTDIGQSEANFKASLLRLDREFRTEIVEPLKVTLVTKSYPDFAGLTPLVDRISTEARKIVVDRSARYDDAWSKLQACQDWKDAEALDSRIDTLKNEAIGLGLDIWASKELRKMDWTLRYHDPEKPGKLVAFFESYIAKAKLNSPKAS